MKPPGFEPQSLSLKKLTIRTIVIEKTNNLTTRNNDPIKVKLKIFRIVETILDYSE